MDEDGLGRDLTWILRARCADPTVGTPGELDAVMFPTGAGETSKSPAVRVAAYAEGKAICAACPVTAECLATAMRVEGGAGSGRFGIRGGLDPVERDAMYRRARDVAKRASRP